MPSRFCIHYVSKSGRRSNGCRIGKGQSSSQFPRMVVPKNVPNHRTVALISHASKVMLKILHARLQYYANQELSGVKAGFRKGRGTRDQIANICLIIEKAREFQKNIYLCFLGYAKPLTACIMTNCGKLLKRWKYQTILAVSWETCLWVKKQQLETYLGQLIGSRSRKEYDRGCLLLPWCLAYTLSTSWEILGLMSYNLESG